MKLDVTGKLMSLDGVVIKDVDANGEAIDATVRVALVNAVLMPDQADKGTDKVEKYELAKKIHTQDVVDVTPEQIGLIKKCVEKAYAPLLVGQLVELLNK